MYVFKYLYIICDLYMHTHEFFRLSVKETQLSNLKHQRKFIGLYNKNAGVILSQAWMDLGILMESSRLMCSYSLSLFLFWP